MSLSAFKFVFAFLSFYLQFITWNYIPWSYYSNTPRTGLFLPMPNTEIKEEFKRLRLVEAFREALLWNKILWMSFGEIVLGSFLWCFHCRLEEINGKRIGFYQKHVLCLVTSAGGSASVSLLTLLSLFIYFGQNGVAMKRYSLLLDDHKCIDVLMKWRGHVRFLFFISFYSLLWHQSLSNILEEIVYPYYVFHLQSHISGFQTSASLWAECPWQSEDRGNWPHLSSV